MQNLDRFAGSRLATWTVWVAPGTLRVADAAKQVGMTEAQLRDINNIPRGMLIKPGSTLLVPRPAHAQVDVTSAVADKGEVSFAPEIVQVRKLVKASKGDSVATIARRYAISPTNVAQWNKVAVNASFKSGQSVVVYVPVTAANAKTGSTKAHVKSTNRSAAKQARAKGPIKAKV